MIKMLEQNGLLTDKSPSILIGAKEEKRFLRPPKKSYIQVPTPSSIFLAGQSRSGKTVSVMIPNALHYSESLVVIANSPEIYEITSDYRREKQEVFVLDCRNIHAQQWNPLSYITRWDANFSRDSQQEEERTYKIARVLYQDTVTKYKDSVMSLFVGLCLFMVETECDKITTLSRLVELTQAKTHEMHFSAWVKYICENHPYTELSEICEQHLLSYTRLNEEDAQEVLNLMLKPLAVDVPYSQKHTGYDDDLYLPDIWRSKTTVYVIHASEHKPLVNVFLMQLNEASRQTVKNYQCLLLIEDFNQLAQKSLMSELLDNVQDNELSVIASTQSLFEEKSVKLMEKFHVHIFLTYSEEKQDCLIQIKNSALIQAQRILYYKEPYFTSKVHNN